MEENESKTEQEETRPATEEEYEDYLKKEKRTNGLIKDILDFILSFFH